MTMPTDFPYLLLAFALVLAVVIVALCRQDYVKTGLKLWFVTFFLEARRNSKEKDRKRLPSTEQDPQLLP